MDVERAILNLRRLARIRGMPPEVIEEAILILERRDQGPSTAAAAAALPVPRRELACV